MKLISLALLLIAGNALASDYLVQLPPGCTVSGKTQLSGSCDAAVPVPVPTAACPSIPNSAGGIFSRWAGMQTVNFGGGGGLQSKDVSKFDSVYGAWPGSYGLIATYLLPTNRYLSLQFTVPANYTTAPNVPVPLFGAMSIGETGNAAQVSATISETCGAFANPATYPTSTVVPGCWKNRMLTGAVLQWNGNSSTKCLLLSGHTYFWNFANIDVSQVQPSGGTAASTKTTACKTACGLPVKNSPGTWSNYTPRP